MAKKHKITKAQNIGKWKRGTQIKIVSTPRPFTSSRGGLILT